MTLPVRPWAAAAACSRPSSVSAGPGAVLGEQNPGQHQILPLPLVARVVSRAEAPFLRPAGGRGDVALGQQQPRPLRRDRVQQAGHRRARRDPPGLAHRLQGARLIPLGLPNPRQRGQARGQRLGVAELAAQRDALGDVADGSVKLVPLVGHLRHAHVSAPAAGRAGWPGAAVISSACW